MSCGDYYNDIPTVMLENKRIFEVGSGYGKKQMSSRHAKIFDEASRRGQYFGIDLHLQQEPALNIIEGDIQTISLQSLSIDTILVMHCIEHISLEDWSAVFSKLTEALRVGGWLIVACPYNELPERSCSPEHVVFEINEDMLENYLSGVRVFKSSIQYPKHIGIRKVIWWFRQFFTGQRVVPLGLTRHSCIAFWRKERFR